MKRWEEGQGKEEGEWEAMCTHYYGTLCLCAAAQASPSRCGKLAGCFCSAIGTHILTESHMHCRMHMQCARTHTHTHAGTHSRTHARTHTHAHTLRVTRIHTATSTHHANRHFCSPHPRHSHPRWRSCCITCSAPSARCTATATGAGSPPAAPPPSRSTRCPATPLAREHGWQAAACLPLPS